MARRSLAASGFALDEEMETTGTGGTARLERTRTYLAGGRLRKEQVPAGTVTIVRDDRRVVWVLDPARRTYFEISRAALERLGAEGASLLPPPAGDAAEAVKRTGARRKVGTFEAYEVRVEDQPVPGTRMSIWLSTDVPIDRSLEGPFGRGGLAVSSPVGRLLEGLRKLEGYPVEVTLAAHVGGQTLTLRRTLTGFERVDVADDRFEVPRGYVRVPGPFDATADEPPAASSSPRPEPRGRGRASPPTSRPTATPH